MAAPGAISSAPGGVLAAHHFELHTRPYSALVTMAEHLYQALLTTTPAFQPHGTCSCGAEVTEVVLGPKLCLR